ncbi:MAG: hypothetical protein ABFS10_09015 [Bacteroidota bacterium]
MKPYLTLFLPLVISLLTGSCSPAGKVTIEEDPAGKVTVDAPPSDNGITRFSPLEPFSEPLLFKANISLFKKSYSGLIFIKKVAVDSTTHVVFLSELGLSLLDLAYKEDCFEVVRVQEFLNRPPVLESMKRDFRTLLLDLSAIESYSLKREEGAGGSEEILRFSHRRERYTYHLTENRGVTLIRRKKSLFRKAQYEMTRDEKLHIRIVHRGIKLHIDLQQLQHSREHADQ